MTILVLIPIAVALKFSTFYMNFLFASDVRKLELGLYKSFPSRRGVPFVRHCSL